MTAWVVYDMAAHAYTLMISGVAFPVYFASHVAADRGNADLLWSWALGLSLLAAGVLGPWIGAVVDAGGGRRLLLAACTGVCAAATASLFVVGPGDVSLAIALFVAAHVAHLVATSLYNSYLPLIAAPSRYARASGIAWGLSYLGSIACFIVCIPLTRNGLAPENVTTFAGTFLVTAAFLAMVGLPAVLGLPGSRPLAPTAVSPVGSRRIVETLRVWRHDLNVPKLLLAYYLANDGIVTVVFFTALTFRRTFGLDVQEILVLSLVVQLVAIPSTILAGWAGGRWSQRGAIYIALALWLVVLAMMTTAEGQSGAWMIAPALGLVLGSTQSLFRSLYAGMVPIDRASEYFGFHTFAGRASAALGPLVFGAISYGTGSQRAAMASLAVFFVASAVVLRSVRLPRG
jgi:MFS transporter, UMF1 family